MTALIFLLITFFTMLIIYQLILAYSDYNIIEGLENDQTYKDYNSNDPNNVMILDQQNAGNIKVLKQQIDGVMKLETQVKDLSNNMVNLQQQVDGIILAQQDYAQQNIPSEPTTVSGTGEDADTGDGTVSAT